MSILRPLVFVFFLFSHLTNVLAQNTTEWQRDTLESYVNRSNEAYDQYNYKEAIKYASTLVKKGQEYNYDYYEFLGYDILGGIYSETEDTIKGKIYSEKALELARSIQVDSLVAWGALNLGILYSDNENTYKKAIQFFKESIEINEQNKDYDEVYLTYVNLIWTYLENNQFDEAYTFLQKAEALSTKEVDSLDKLYMDLLYGKYYLAKKKYNTAALKLEKIAQTADKIENTDLAIEAYDDLAKLYSETDDYQKAFANLDKYNQFKQKAYTLKKLEETEKARVKFDLEQAQKDLKTALKEHAYSEELISKSQSLTTVLIGAIVILVLALFGIIVFFKTRKTYINNLRAKNRQLSLANAKAEKLSKVKTKFLSTVSHELRTPLYGVIGISTLLKEDKNLKAYADDLSSLKFSADYLLALINDVLLLSKMDAEAITLSKIPYELDVLIQNIVRSFEFSLHENSNKLHLQVDKNIPNNLVGDPIRFSQILINLMGNAIKFTEKGNIWLKLVLVEPVNGNTCKVKFTVKDDGLGIPENMQEEIFKEFTQIENKNYSYTGTGLGLTIVKKILDLYKSEIHLKSEPNKGAEFSFQLTLKKQTKQDKESSLLNGNTNISNSIKNSVVRHVLVVDDNKINQKVTQKTLDKYNIKSSLADDGEQAVIMSRANDYDLILMDINMPNINGMEATRMIREYDKEIPIIALTAVELDEGRKEILNSGMNDIIHKPYNLPEFLDTIFKYLPKEEVENTH
ncbi:tetratricopeptide repeat-containing hybrid sensor histidine kinase/response regulator [Zobellia uliginosa]|uniref:tetratricopeptide repeat-containing hybrid sensor histidine kinase/response regulator n=1 Tax=Zobellia uliginosa TaxID=143224 RepID=UPI001C07C1DE|nr:response regulator [Zobellia uliginosa]MBU2946019.1 response regulator [Zobellia uliginosa]